MSLGFGAFGGKAAQRFFVLGWVPFSTVTAASLGTITVVLGLSHQPLRYWLSLPLSVRQVVAVKLVMGVTMGLIVAAATLAFSVVWILRSLALLNSVTALVLFLLTVATSGLLAALSILVRDITKMSILTILISSILQYLSSVYVPMDSLDPWLRALLLVNPVTLASEVLRTGDAALLAALAAEASLFFVAGVYVLALRVRTQLE
ncbi:ABC-type polysaccharide/polyol phosphate export permease [Oceanithermus desulfurans]|uniref:ABC-type polysaccharide/polyol phosphate export permease n=1 Tax=Oceanithermus desulfurans TaxID=227924 RepID=A0ABR6P430_9DEIN|nr:ABC-type polysaccharide/polyol phosphate export permease [Oceanithermus desulfurans]